MSRAIVRIECIMKKIDKLRQLRCSTAHMDEFAKSACNYGLTVSMGEGRRLWHQLAPKEAESEDRGCSEHSSQLQVRAVAEEGRSDAEH